MKEEIILSDIEFLEAKTEYLKMSKSALFIKHRDVTREFAINLGKISDLEILRTEESFIKWISENFNSTEFKNIDEAVQLRRQGVELQQKLENENKELFKLLNRASVEQKKVILKPKFYSRLSY